MSVDRADPGRGDPAGMLAASRERASKATTVRAAQNEMLRAAAEADPSVWSGQARESFVAAAAAAAMELGTLASRWDAESAALSMYGRGVQEVKDQQRVLQLRRDEAEDDLRAARRGVRDAELDLSSSHWEVGGDPDEAQREVDRAKGNATAASGLLVGIEREWDLLFERREHLDRECIAALTGEGVLGSMSRLSGGGAGGNPFAGLSAIDMLVLARTDRRTLERLSTSDPAAVQEWWAGLGEDQQDALVSAMPAFIGALNGVPALSRVAANRLLAAEQLRKIRSQRSFADVDGAPTLRSEFGAGDDLIRYLERVVAGEVQLYLWQPENGAVIEMSGNPETARSALFVVPGTNASISEFTSTIPTTRFAGRLARDADPAGSVVAFTVLTGPMPYLTADPFDLWSNGPQNNPFAAARAPELAAFEKGIFATLPGVPTVSYENSYASAIGSGAEAYGGTPTVRVLSAGVGATYGYEPAPDVTRYAVQAPNDINRYYAGMQAGEVGFGVAPESIPGITILESGQSGLPMNPQIAGIELAVGGPLAVGVQIPDSVSNHIDTMSDDPSVNGSTLRQVKRILSEVQGK